MMTFEPIRKITGTAVNIPGDDIDTDRIIPARFLKCVTFEDLGDHLFEDARAAERAEGRVHPLDDPRRQGATIMLSGANFGCGSSREHAPQSIYRYGIRAIVAESFAEIFFGNCSTIGLPCLQMEPQDLTRLALQLDAEPSLEIAIDLEELVVTAGSFRAAVRLAESARQAFLAGSWDPLSELLEARELVAGRAASLPYLSAR